MMAVSEWAYLPNRPKFPLIYVPLNLFHLNDMQQVPAFAPDISTTSTDSSSSRCGMAYLPLPDL